MMAAMPNLAHMLTDTAAAHPERTAIKLDDLQIPYAVLEQGSRKAAGMLAARGIEPGDRIGLMLPNVPYFPFLFYGALRAGAIVVPMNPLLKEREVAFHLGDSGAKLLFAWHQFAAPAEAGAIAAGADFVSVETGEIEKELFAAEALDDLVERDDDDTALILYTSGTTGTPKGAELTHGNLGAATDIAVGLVDKGPADVSFGGLPLFHVFGLTSGLTATVRVGACLTLLPRFDAQKALDMIARDQVTTFLGVPTMYAAMLHHPGADAADASSLDLCVSGGAAMPVEVLRGFEAQFGCKVLEGYGLSESTAIASFNRPDRERKPGSIGIPVPDTEMRLAEEEDGIGEILVKGPTVMKGYWNRPDATAETLQDGWLRTGDMARIDDEGYYFIVDRKKELVIRGGFNVYPREIEEVLYEHHAVREAAVLGVPDESLGEEIAAAVVLRDGESATPEELRDYVKGRVAAYKYPRHVWLADELPKGPTGKVLKRAIQVPEG
jgi:long-chain acyl-CoA synthetase